MAHAATPGPTPACLPACGAPPTKYGACGVLLVSTVQAGGYQGQGQAGPLHVTSLLAVGDTFFTGSSDGAIKCWVLP